MIAGCGGGSGSETPSGSTPTRTGTPTETAPATATPTAEPTTTERTTDPTTANGESLADSIRVAEVSAQGSPVRQTRPTTATVRVASEFEERVEALVAVSVDGRFRAGPSVEVPAGGSAETAVEFAVDAAGERPYEVVVRVGGEAVATATGTVSVAPYPEHHVDVDGTDLVCGDGTVHFAGASPSTAFYPGSIGAGIEETFDAIDALGVTSARVWGFAPSWAEMDSMPGPYSYNPAWFEYFDRVVAAAKRRDIRLFVAMINGNPAYGPVSEENLSVNVPQFVRWADDAETRNDFFDSEECMAMFEGWAETLLTHENHVTGLEYRDDPTIAMWELGNEIQMSPPRVGESIRPWIESAGEFVEGIDDRTLLTTGSYGHQGRNAFVDEASADPIDVASIHYYPGPEHYDLPESEVLDTLSSTIATTREEIGKPLYVGEYNWGVREGESAPYEERAAWLDRLHGVMAEGEVAATNLWTVGVADRPTSYHKPATIYAPEEGLTLERLATHAAAMQELSTSSCVDRR